MFLILRVMKPTKNKEDKGLEIENSVFKPKMRVTLLNEQGIVVQDRLVDTASELYAGPKNVHNGPIRLEVTLVHKEDIDSFKNYIDQLQGNLPLKPQTNGRGRPTSGLVGPTLTESPREDILAEVQKMASEGKNQTDVIKYLRNLGFVFILTEDFKFYFPEFEFKEKDVGKPHHNGQYLHSLSWMVRCIRKGKDPKTDKFDPMIIFGFSIMDGPSKKVVPYLYKERKEPIKIKEAKKTLSFSSVEFTKLPAYQTEEERLKFSFEQRQLMLNPDKKPSKFFLRWANDVEIPTSAWEKLKGRGISFKNFKDE